jgi:hypothetical protein
MQKQVIVSMLLFFVFFAIGVFAITFCAFFDDLYAYYQNKELLKQSQALLEKLKVLNSDYETLLKQLKGDPQLAKRIAPTLGVQPEDGQTAYPKATAEQLAAAKAILMEESKNQPEEQTMPRWIERCRSPFRRIILFIAGSALILISFVYFGPKFGVQNL